MEDSSTDAQISGSADMSEVEKRIIRTWLMYPDTKCFYESENDEEIVIKVVVKK